MSDRLGPQTAGKRKTPPQPAAPTHGAVKQSTKEAARRRREKHDRTLRAAERGKAGQPPRPAPAVRKP
jgi:hypothetical protein